MRRDSGGTERSLRRRWWRGRGRRNPLGSYHLRRWLRDGLDYRWLTVIGDPRLQRAFRRDTNVGGLNRWDQLHFFGDCFGLSRWKIGGFAATHRAPRGGGRLGNWSGLDGRRAPAAARAGRR